MKKILILFITFFVFSDCSINKKDDQGEVACGIEDCDEEETSSYSLLDNKIDIKDALLKIENGDDVVLYFYFDACPWCKELGPLLSNYLSDKDKLSFITYAINVRPDGIKENDFRYKNEDGEYNNVDFEEIYDLVYEYLDDDRIFYVPTLLFIKDGKIVYYHTGTVEGHDAKERELANDEKATLLEMFEEYYMIYEN